jgi:Na+:H+ antiporter, NhaA family
MMMVRADSVAIELDVKHWINDGLMTLFVFVVGLEIKRELVHGELNEWRRAALPVAAAVGGILDSTSAAKSPREWGILMATDIVFARGVLALLRDRIPKVIAYTRESPRPTKKQFALLLE